ncbi:MAG: glycoside hydrolase family 140 protein [Acidobacteriota bacterium]|nr:glycoside hydrolase family 140 protein [Acidobacteriota bacterium]
MKRQLFNRTRLTLLACLLLTSAPQTTRAQTTKPVYPLKVSANGRHFVDQNNLPFLYKACTGWQLFSKLTKAEAELYLENRRQKGFNTIQAQLLPWEADGKNRDGDAPFLPLGDMRRPNEPYFQHVAWVIRKAAEKGIQIVINPLWIRQDSWRSLLTNANAEQYGRFLGERYKDFDNVVWFHGGDMNPLDKIDEIRQLAAGIEATDARHLQSYHAGRGEDGSSTSSAQLFHRDAWLDFNFGYCYGPHDVSRNDPYNYVQHVRDYNRKPAKPFILAESYYERERNHTGADRIRRQGYWTILSGGAGYAYGNFPVYAFDDNWQSALEDPGARHLAHLSKLFAAHDWHNLVPDFDHEVVVDGYGVFGAANYVTAARSSDGALVMAYVPPIGTNVRTLTVDMSKLKNKADAKWFNPASGSYTEIGAFANSGNRQFKTPGNNGDNQNDWVLVIESQP